MNFMKYLGKCLFCFILLTLFISGCSFGTPTIKVEQQILDLINSWDSNVCVLTSSSNPLRTLDGLTSDNIGCWGSELAQNVKDIYKGAGINESSVQVIGLGNTIFEGNFKNIRLFIIWKQNISKINNAVEVRFVAK